MKKKVTKRIPVLLTNSATVPHCPQLICRPDGSEPHVTKRVPTMKMKNKACPLPSGVRAAAFPYLPDEPLAARAFFADFFAAAGFDSAAPPGFGPARRAPARSNW